MIEKVICPCYSPDLGTFVRGASEIQKYIAAKSYVVIVPEHDVPAFENSDIGSFKVESYEKYADIGQYLKTKIGNHGRFGSYFSSLIKLAALSEGHPDDAVLMWDSDMIPIKKLDFERNDQLFFYQSDEFHKPYFDVIEKISGLKKISQTSFVVGCLPCRAKHFHAFVADIEKNKNLKWYQIIIDAIDTTEPYFSTTPQLSEHEMMRTYILKNFPDEVILSDRTDNWYRLGNSLIGGPQNIPQNHHWLSQKYDFLVFETWDHPTAFLMKTKESIYNFFCKA